jgi:hypothetical protein
MHVNADALSREANPVCENPGFSSLPCGGCHYSKRAYARWTEFNFEIDDMVPLSLFGPFADSDKSDFSKPMAVCMVTRSGKNTDSLDNAASTITQPGTVDIPEVCSEPTAQLVPPEPIKQSGAEARVSPDSTEK